MTSTPSALKLLRTAIAVVVVFALGGIAWMVASAVRNPDVRARRPGWVEGTFDAAYWLPLILTFALGCAAVIFVYHRAARRLREGEDLHASGFREGRRRELESMKSELARRDREPRQG